MYYVRNLAGGAMKIKQANKSKAVKSESTVVKIKEKKQGANKAIK
jgi:hypothetical protein|tara:strand:- start:1013 stop:1147 length:135 start_codon:yes stop_codon:yes gene_type:complete